MVHHLVHERVGEAVSAAFAAPSDLLNQISFHQEVERDLGARRIGGNGTQQRFVEQRAQHGRLLQQSAGIGGKPIDAREQQPVQCWWNFDRLAGHRARPSPALAHQHALADEAAHDFLYEQRVSPGARGDKISNPSEGVAGHCAKQATHQRQGLATGERNETDDGLRSPRDERRARIGSMGDQHHQAPIREMVGNVPQHVHRGGVGPMQVFHDEQKRHLI